MTDSVSSLAFSAAALAGVVGSILLIGRLLQHITAGPKRAPGKSLIVKETVALDARRRLHLIQHGDVTLLLATGGANDLFIVLPKGSASQ